MFPLARIITFIIAIKAVMLAVVVCETLVSADAIINNVRPVPDINAAKDNDLRARFGMMRDMLASIKKR